MPVTYLPPFAPGDPSERVPLESSNPMRELTRALALGDAAWTPDAAHGVRRLFDELAPAWDTRKTPSRFVPIKDSLTRGGPLPDGLTVELGSGTGLATGLLAERFSRLIAVDLSMEMLRLAPRFVPRVRADAAQLPLADGSVQVLVLINMLLFPAEAARVLNEAGVLIWVNTSGPDTPIYLSADELERALPGEWDIVASEAAHGTWCVARRE